MEFTIKEAAKKVGLTAHTIRYYDQEGLLPFVKRDKNGNRIFRENDVEWLLFILCLRDTGMSIEEMKHFVQLSIEGDDTVAERKRVLQRHRRSIEEKIEEMKRYLEKIDEKMNCYTALDQCKKTLTETDEIES